MKNFAILKGHLDQLIHAFASGPSRRHEIVES